MGKLFEHEIDSFRIYTFRVKANPHWRDLAGEIVLQYTTKSHKVKGGVFAVLQG